MPVSYNVFSKNGHMYHHVIILTGFLGYLIEIGYTNPKHNRTFSLKREDVPDFIELRLKQLSAIKITNWTVSGHDKTKNQTLNDMLEDISSDSDSDSDLDSDYESDSDSDDNLERVYLTGSKDTGIRNQTITQVKIGDGEWIPIKR